MSKTTLSKTSVMIVLVKREFQEYRALFVYLPLAVALLLALQFGATTVGAYMNDVFLAPFKPLPNGVIRSAFVMPGVLSYGSLGAGASGTVIEFAALSERIRAVFVDAIYSVPEILSAIYRVVMPFYFLMTMYQQRKNRSILFWNSMPISSAQTIASKLLAGVIGCQAVFLLCILLLKVFLLLGLLAYGSLYPIDVWQTFVAPSHFFSNCFALLRTAALNTVWTLPVYAWLLLASAGSRSMPFAWAAGPVVVGLGIEFLITQKPDTTLLMLGHLFPSPFPHNALMFSGKYPGELNLELALCAVLGLALIYAAIRFNRSEDV